MNQSSAVPYIRAGRESVKGPVSAYLCRHNGCRKLARHNPRRLAVREAPGQRILGRARRGGRKRGPNARHDRRGGGSQGGGRFFYDLVGAKPVPAAAELAARGARAQEVALLDCPHCAVQGQVGVHSAPALICFRFTTLRNTKMSTYTVAVAAMVSASICRNNACVVAGG